MKQSFYSHGKLLLTSEYLVLDGAAAVALPTKKGQHLEIESTEEKAIAWKSTLANGNEWFSSHYSIPLAERQTEGSQISERLLEILKAAQKLNPNFLNNAAGFNAESKLEFPKDWGLGSSSTLITNIALWANVNPYELLKLTFGGSGYDIACATSKSAILYSRKNTQPIVTSVDFNPSFKNHIFFVYLNRKQNSRDSIKHYRSLSFTDRDFAVKEFSNLSNQIINCDTLEDFERLLNLHEEELSKILQTPTIKSELFVDYPRTIKSLGGWGGDFVLATGDASHQEYFYNKGFATIIPFSEMIL